MELSKEIREAHLAALRERLREKVGTRGFGVYVCVCARARVKKVLIMFF